MSRAMIARLIALAAFLGCVIGSVWMPGLAVSALIIAIVMWLI